MDVRIPENPIIKRSPTGALKMNDQRRAAFAFNRLPGGSGAIALFKS
jgi:hypothetical protein